jgi:metal-sulfur cluster biosynthetic enzyme
MRVVLIFFAVLFLFACNKSSKCIEELVIISEVEITENENDVSIRIIYGISGCEYYKSINEEQTDSTFEIRIIKCIEN